MTALRLLAALVCRRLARLGLVWGEAWTALAERLEGRW
jgi:hypothetical protein